MTFDEYQDDAAATDPSVISKNSDISVLLLGLSGETGSLLTLYKKWLRDGDAYQIVKERLGEEMGDILWYLAAIARQRGLSLDEIAQTNLRKTQSRWLEGSVGPLFDVDRPASEQLPRLFTAELRDTVDSQGKPVMCMTLNGESLGSRLTDNSYERDGYRFHDIFHLALACMMGWSPVIRALLHVKRKSDAKLDEVEDGGRRKRYWLHLTRGEKPFETVVFVSNVILNSADSRLRFSTRLRRTCRARVFHRQVPLRRKNGVWNWPCYSK